MKNGRFPTRAEVAELRRKYPCGTIIELENMEDEYTNLRAGDIGTVQYVDDAGQLHMQWRRGQTLALIPGVDDFRVIGMEESI